MNVPVIADPLGDDVCNQLANIYNVAAHAMVPLRVGSISQAQEKIPFSDPEFVFDMQMKCFRHVGRGESFMTPAGAYDYIRSISKTAKDVSPPQVSYGLQFEINDGYISLRSVMAGKPPRLEMLVD